MEGRRLCTRRRYRVLLKQAKVTFSPLTHSSSSVRDRSTILAIEIVTTARHIDRIVNC